MAYTGKINIKFLFLILASLYIGLSAHAASLTAQEVLDRMVNEIRNAGSVRMSMTIQNGSATFNADLLLSKEKFNYNAGSLIVYYDGSTQWTVDKDAKEVSITVPTIDEIAETNPLAFIQSYKKKYKVSLTGSSGGTYTVRLDAVGKSSYIRTAQVVVSASTWMPTHITARLSTGQTLTIRISGTEKGSGLPLSTFRFEAKSFPGYELIDLR